MKRMQGLSLMEVMLALAIAVLIIIMSIRQYQSWQNDTSVRQVDANVNALFQAMQFYYESQCFGQYNNADGSVVYGSLSPVFNKRENPPYVPPYIYITGEQLQSDFIRTVLRQNGYLLTPYPFPLSPIVADVPKNYQVGFMLYTDIRNQPVSNPNPNGSNSVSVGSVGHILLHVAVQLATTDPNLESSYLQLLNGDCLSSTVDVDCKTKDNQCTAGSPCYVIWQRLPSFASARSRSDYAYSDPNVTSFTRQYMNYPVTLVTSGAHLTNASGGSAQAGSPTTYQFYLCGD